MNSRSINKRTTRQYDRLGHQKRGAAVVEFAALAPVMILFTFGLIEIGRVSMVRQTITHATREGARVAIRPHATTADVEQRVSDEIASFDLAGTTIETDPVAVQLANPGDDIMVRVRVDLSQVSWVPNYFLFSNGEMVVETVMRRESTN